MEILLDYYLVTIDQLYDKSTTPSGIVTLNSAYIAEDTEDHYINKRIYGTVVGCPVGFSDTTVEVIDPGIPAPRKYISGDYLQMRANQGYNGRVYKKDRSYYPGTFEEFEAITLVDIAKKTNIHKGQRVYFDYNATEEENLRGKFRGQDMYQIRIDEIYCTVDFKEKIISGGGSQRPVIDLVPKITMQGGWVLVEPDMESWESITTPSGIIKKPNPEIRELRGQVKHIGKRPDVKRNDWIIFTKFADAIMNIEGHNYFCMHESDIICKY